MCTTIEFPDRSVGSVKGLRAVLGDSDIIGFDIDADGNLVRREYTGDEDQCLCGVNVPITLCEAGYWVRKSPFGYEATKGGAE